MQPFFTYKKTSTLGGQFAPKKGGQFDRNFHFDREIGVFNWSGGADCPCNILAGISTKQNILFNIYPNPVKDILNLDLTTPQIINIKITDMIGNEVLHLINMTKSIDVSTLGKGMYLLQLQTPAGILTNKFIKE